MKILKYEIKNVEGQQTVGMPKGSKIISSQIRSDKVICFWVMAYQDQTYEPRYFEVLETGKFFAFVPREFIATLKCTGFTVHLFELNLKNADHA